jgi:hypothetical protein
MKKQLFQVPLIMISVCMTTSAIFDPVPGDQLWVMINQIGLINQTIAGCVMPVTANDIDNTGVTISAPGNYAFIQDVQYSPVGINPAPAIHITSNDVSLSLNNFTLSTTNNNAVLISVASGVSNVVIKDAHLTNGRHGIQLVGSNAYITITHVAVDNTVQEGILIATGADHIACNEVSCLDSGSHGIAINGTNTDIGIFNSLFANNTGEGALIQATNLYIAKSSATGNSMNGFNINTSSNLLMYQCRGSNNTGDGIHLATITGVIMSDIITNGNQSAGISCDTLTSLRLSNVNSDSDITGIKCADNTSLTLENVIISRAVNNGIITNGTSETESIYKNITIYTPGTNGINFFDANSQMVIENANIFAPLGVSPTDGFGIEFAFDTHSAIMRDITIINPENSGIHFDVFTACTDINIDDTFVSLAADGILCEAGTERIQITDSQFINNARQGISFVTSSTGITIQNAVCMANQDRGINIDTFDVTLFDAVEVSNCFLISNINDGLTLAGCTSGSITENTVINNATDPLVAANGMTIGTSVVGSFFTYVGFNDFIFNNEPVFTHYNLQTHGSTLFPGKFDIGIAGNFTFCDTYACNYDTSVGNDPSRFNAAEFDVISGWNGGTHAGAHWQNVSCQS